jgi:hypothetical protein
MGDVGTLPCYARCGSVYPAMLYRARLAAPWDPAPREWGRVGSVPLLVARDRADDLSRVAPLTA